MKNSRLEWVDWTKILGMLLVVLGHMNIAKQDIEYIYSFHMPLFFFLSGYLEKDKGLKKIISRSYQSLVVPYLLLCMLSYPWWYFVAYHRHPELFHNGVVTDALVKPFLGIVFGVGYNTKWSTVINIPLWFLLGLFWCRVLNRILWLTAKAKATYYLLEVALLVGLVLFLKTLKVDLLFSIDSALLAMPFFAIGYLLKNTKIYNSKRKWLYMLTAIATAPLTYILSTHYGKVDINLFEFGSNILLFYLLGLLGSISFIALGLFLTGLSSKISAFFSSGMILILAFHWMLASIIIDALHLSNKQVAVFIAIPVAVLILAAMAAPIFVAKKWFPLLLGKPKLKLQEVSASTQERENSTYDDYPGSFAKSEAD
jgi:acyltransferase